VFGSGARTGEGMELGGGDGGRVGEGEVVAAMGEGW